jgi:hypothetical protein
MVFSTRLIVDQCKINVVNAYVVCTISNNSTRTSRKDDMITQT